MENGNRRRGEGFWGLIGKLALGIGIGLFVGNEDIRSSVIGACKKGGDSIKGAFSKEKPDVPESGNV